APPLRAGTDRTRLAQRLGGDAPLHLGELRQVHHRVLAAPDVGETALRNPADERHLAAFEAGPAAVAGAGLLPLLAAAGGLAEPGAGTAPHPLLRMLAPLGRGQLMQLHSSTSSRYWIFRTMPRTAGVSGRSTWWRIRRRPRLLSTSRCPFLVPMPLFTWLILIFLPSSPIH